MDIKTWLDADRGRTVALAQHFGVTQSAISQWRDNGVPTARMKAVRDFTGGVVTLEDMLPDEKRNVLRGPHDDERPAIDVAAPAKTAA